MHHSRLGLMLALALLGAAIVLGGGGSPAPVPELALEWLALALGAAWLLMPATRDDWRRVPRSAWLVTGLIVAVPLIQLIPLPPALWQRLPGRDMMIDTLALIGQDQTWRPISMLPEHTLAALFSLLPPLVLLLIATSLPSRHRAVLLFAVLGGGLATLLLGALQLTSGPESPVQLYSAVHSRLRGFQANFNSTADVLLAALLAGYALIRLAALRRWIPDAAGPVFALALLVTVLFGFGIIFTASRTGIVLLPLAVLAGLWLLRGWFPPMTRRGLAIALAALVGAGLIGATLVRSNPNLAVIGDRFLVTKDLRTQLWQDGLYVARKHYPVGVGMGGFVPALVAEERLEVVRPSMPNRAHNEYVELGVEAGLVGYVAWGLVILLLARAGLASLRHGSNSGRVGAWFGLSLLALLVLHSMVDYPFRSMALAVIGALCAAMLLGHENPLASGPTKEDER